MPDSTQYAQRVGMPGNAVVLPLLTTRSGVGRTALGLRMLLAQTHSLSYQSCRHCVEHQDPPTCTPGGMRQHSLQQIHAVTHSVSHRVCKSFGQSPAASNTSLTLVFLACMLHVTCGLLSMRPMTKHSCCIGPPCSLGLSGHAMHLAKC